jgi:hypothetical protein
MEERVCRGAVWTEEQEAEEALGVVGFIRCCERFAVAFFILLFSFLLSSMIMLALAAD